MSDYILPVFGVFIGVFIAFFVQKKEGPILKLLLAFSGAFLLAITLFELLPEVYEHSKNTKHTGLLIMSGIILQIILELFSQGAEHGHSHHENNQKTFPWLLFISLCVHSFLEGFPINQHNDMVYGIVVHKIPIATLIASFLFQADYGKTQIALFLLIFAMMTPLGTFISNESMSIAQYMQQINAVVIGIFFHIGTTIIFESGQGHKFNLSKFAAISLGVVMAYLI